MIVISQWWLWWVRRLALLGVIPFVLGGCIVLDDLDDDDASQGDDDDITYMGDDDDDDIPDVTPELGSYSLSGTVSYEYVPYNFNGGGLNYGAIEERLIRGVPVGLVDVLTDETILETVVGDDGAFSFEWDGTNYVKLWVYSETMEPHYIVEDNTHADSIYVAESEMLNAIEITEYDFVATTGWNGVMYEGARASAPFAILDAVYTAAHRFLTETTSPPEFPELHVNWSKNNRPESGDKSQGQITTSHWDQQELWILGKENVDTDEFDSHVIVHEWGHYFESKISRSDSIGGGHSSSDILDPRVALGEGWGNAVSAMILDPDTVYTDSLERSQAQGFYFDLEDNDHDSRDNPGWFSEGSIQAILFDLYDGPNEAFDGIELGLDGLYQVLVGNEKTTHSLTTLFSFIATLKTLRPDLVDEIDTLVTYQSANSALGVDPVQDDWATGETHDADFEDVLPLYKVKSVGDSFSVTLDGRYDFNKLAQNRFYRFEGNGSPLTIASTSSEDVDIYVLLDGEYVTWAATESGNESATFSSQNGAEYVLNIQGWGDVKSSYSATIQISN